MPNPLILRTTCSCYLVSNLSAAKLKVAQKSYLTYAQNQGFKIFAKNKKDFKSVLAGLTGPLTLERSRVKPMEQLTKPIQIQEACGPHVQMDSSWSKENKQKIGKSSGNWKATAGPGPRLDLLDRPTKWNS